METLKKLKNSYYSFSPYPLQNVFFFSLLSDDDTKKKVGVKQNAFKRRLFFCLTLFH